MSVVNLIYDGTFEGFLSCVFYSYDYKLTSVFIQNKKAVQQSFFSKNDEVITDPKKAERVWNGLKKRLSASAQYQIYAAFLSEQEHIENVVFNYVRQVFESKLSIEKDYANPIVLKVAQIAKSVGREKHRMEAFVRFRLTKDAIYFATIEPDFNVLPLILKHFKRRYADQKWLIYDVKRRYGIYYDLAEVNHVELELPENFDATKTDKNFFADAEFNFQTLWQDYFKSTNIKSRKNMKLHIKHVPKRYWKYLSEKQPF